MTDVQSPDLTLAPEALKAVADLLGGERIVAYRPYFANAFGGAACALLLSQFWFWTNTPTVKKRDAQWFWKSQKEITEETGLTRTETDTARRKLREAGVLMEAVRGVPATVHYRLDKEVIYALLWLYLQSKLDEFAGFPQTGLQKSDKLVRGKPANKAAGNLQTISETPAKKNQRKTQGDSPAASSRTDDGEEWREVYRRGRERLGEALKAAERSGGK